MCIGQGPRHRVEIRNCQTWMREVVGVLVGEGMLGSEALDVVDEAPKN